MGPYKALNAANGVLRRGGTSRRWLTCGYKPSRAVGKLLSLAMISCFKRKRLPCPGCGFHTRMGFYGFPITGAAADKAQWRWGFHLAVFPASVPQKCHQGFCNFLTISTRILWYQYTVVTTVQVLWILSVHFLKVSSRFPGKDMSVYLPFPQGKQLEQKCQT